MTIKIRFLRLVNKNGEEFLIQRKTWFGWIDITYSVAGGFGDSICYPYKGNTKEELLTEVLEHHYRMDRRFVKVIEYPEIKYY